GIALDRGLLPSLEVRVADYFPEVEDPAVDPRVQSLTLRNLLTMTARLAPLAPAAAFSYDNLSAHLASVLLSRVAGQSTALCAHQWLLGPLGIWPADPPRFPWRTAAGGPHHEHPHARFLEGAG